MRQIGKYLGFMMAVAAVTTLNACGSDSNGDATGGKTSSGGSSGTSGGGANTGGSNVGTGGASGNYTRDAVCLVRHRSKATKTTLSGYEEIAMTTADGNDTDLCVVRFQVERVGPAAMPEGCKVAATLPPEEDCDWTHEVKYSNPVTMLDTDGVCAKSQLGLTAAKIASINNSKITYGFAPEAAGHASLAMRYDTKWEIFVNGTWDDTEGTDEFRFDQKDRCKY